MFSTLNALYATITMFFSAMTKFAAALNNIAGVTEATSAECSDEARIGREEKRFIRGKQYAAIKAKYAAAEANGTTIIEAPKEQVSTVPYALASN